MRNINIKTIIDKLESIHNIRLFEDIAPKDIESKDVISVLNCLDTDEINNVLEFFDYDIKALTIFFNYGRESNLDYSETLEQLKLFQWWEQFLTDGIESDVTLERVNKYTYVISKGDNLQ